jgi:hypothetical protein
VNFQYIQDYYRVPAERGRRVICSGKPGVIMESIRQYIGVQFDGEDEVLPYHPTHEVIYGELVKLPETKSWKCLAPWRDEFDSSAWFTVEAETRSKARYKAFKHLRYDCECEIEDAALLYIKVRRV